MLQSILYILARQLRLLGTTIEIRESSMELVAPGWKQRESMRKFKGVGGSPSKRSPPKRSPPKQSPPKRSPPAGSAEKGGRRKNISGRDRGKDGSNDDEEGLPGQEEKVRGGRSAEERRRDREKGGRGGVDGRRKSTYGDDDERRGRPKHDDEKRRARGKSIPDDERGGRRMSTYNDDDKERRRKSTYDDDHDERASRRSGHSGRDADRQGSSQVVSGSRAPTRVGSIEVVPYSQFDLLRKDVDELRRKTGPIPSPTMPDNRRLRKDLAAGSATLVDTMEAMQVAARVRATEDAICRFSEMITHLAASGHLPKDIASRMPDVKFRSKTDVRNYDDEDTTSTRGRKRSSTRKGGEGGSGPGSPGSKDLERFDGVTHREMEEALGDVKAELLKNMNDVMTKATSASDGATALAKSIAEKIEMASELNSRVAGIQNLIQDYADQLDGFDSGLNIQIQGIQEQIAQMRGDLEVGVAVLETSQGNPETAAVRELNERYEGLVSDLETTATSHGKLQGRQRHLNEDLTNLMNAVEMLREQKADNEEVLDLLRDKADRTSLTGLVTEEEFQGVRGQLESRLQACYYKFDLQQATWFNALTDLTAVTENKAELLMFMGMKDDASSELNSLKSRLDYLTKVLGEPKAAILTRLLAKEASCGVCRVPALMDIMDVAAGKPPSLPAFYPQGVEQPQEEVCERDRIPFPKDEREHICHRWAGGSHTIVNKNVTKQRAEPMDPRGVPTRKYDALGPDNRYYQFEEELKPCEECNKILEEQIVLEVPPLQLVGAAGDQGRRGVTVVDLTDNVSIKRREIIASHQDMHEGGDRQDTLKGGHELVRRKNILDETAIRHGTAVGEKEIDIRRATIMSVKSVEEEQVSHKLEAASSRRPTVVDVDQGNRKVSLVGAKGEGNNLDDGDVTVKGDNGQDRRRVTLAPEKL